MDDPYTYGRRTFLKTGATAAAVGAIACGSGGRWRVLSDAEARILAAACDRIVPPDDFPGAAGAGAVEFIDRQLATREADRVESWRRGLNALEATALDRHRRSFAALEVLDQDALLRAVEAGEVAGADWEGVEPRAFFDRLVRFTLMGFYGDPRHGGNRDYASWRMLGVPPAPVRGRLQVPDREDG